MRKSMFLLLWEHVSYNSVALQVLYVFMFCVHNFCFHFYTYFGKRTIFCLIFYIYTVYLF